MFSKANCLLSCGMQDSFWLAGCGILCALPVQDPSLESRWRLQDPVAELNLEGVRGPSCNIGRQIAPANELLCTWFWYQYDTICWTLLAIDAQLYSISFAASNAFFYLYSRIKFNSIVVFSVYMLQSLRPHMWKVISSVQIALSSLYEEIKSNYIRDPAGYQASVRDPVTSWAVRDPAQLRLTALLLNTNTNPKP